MGGNQGDAGELLISPELLEHLFKPLQDVLKENGEAVVELSDQMKVVVTLITAHPTRQTITDSLEKHNVQAGLIYEEVKSAKASLIRWMWTVGLIWASIEAVQSWHLFFTK